MNRTVKVGGGGGGVSQQTDTCCETRSRGVKFPQRVVLCCNTPPEPPADRLATLVS